MLVGTAGLNGSKRVEKLKTHEHFKEMHIGLGRWLSG